MNKDHKYIELIRKLHKAERRIQDILPLSLNDVTWGKMGSDSPEGFSGVPYKKDFIDMLPTELQRIEFRRLKKARQDVYFEIFDYYDNDIKKIEKWFKEYHNLDINDGSYKSDTMFDKDNKVPFLKPKNAIGEIIVSGEDSVVIPCDKLPVTYQVIDKFPVNDGNTVNEAYRVKVNSVELTISHNMFQVIEYVKEKYGNDRFHFPEILRDLDNEGILTSDYGGNPNQLFRTRKGLLHILFKPDDSKEKGMWRCRIKYWTNDFKH